MKSRPQKGGFSNYTRRPVSRVLCLDFARRWPFIWDRSHLLPLATYPGRGAEMHHMRPLFGLASGGVYRAASVTGNAVRSYRTLSPLPVLTSREVSAIGGLLSVALSVGSRPPGVTWRRISVKPGLSSLAG